MDILFKVYFYSFLFSITKGANVSISATLKGHQLVVTGIDFNTDCSRICSGSRDNSVRIWDIETSTCLDNSKLSRYNKNQVIIKFI